MHNFSDLLGIYEREVVPLRHRRLWQSQMIAILRQRFGDTPLSEMTPERLEAWRNELFAAGRSVSTVRKYLYFMSGIYRRVSRTADGRQLVTSNPVTKISLPAEPRGLKKRLALQQVRTLLDAARPDPVMWRWTLLMLRTGMRVEEAMAVRWCDVDAGNGEIAIRQTKTGSPRRVATGAELARHLRAWRAGAKLDDPVIGRRYESIPYHRFRALFRRAGIPWGAGSGGFTARNLRTTFCTLAFQAGADAHILSFQTGHSIRTLLDYYADASAAQRTRVVNMLKPLT